MSTNDSSNVNASTQTNASDQLLRWLNQTKKEDPWNALKKDRGRSVGGNNDRRGCIGGAGGTAMSSLRTQMGSGNDGGDGSTGRK
ncbi:hypothetical protein ANO14919_040350 [Xylariales sp. No.14919]|nr:hypothetical protein ANO14919_040350 [Xylariales sp. No.14919]